MYDFLSVVKKITSKLYLNTVLISTGGAWEGQWSIHFGNGDSRHSLFTPVGTLSFLLFKRHKNMDTARNIKLQKLMKNCTVKRRQWHLPLSNHRAVHRWRPKHCLYIDHARISFLSNQDLALSDSSFVHFWYSCNNKKN